MNAVGLSFCAMLLIGAAIESSAQSFQGGVRGVVRDASGVIPGVEVTLTNEATNIVRSTVSNETGLYVFAVVDPGTYTVRAGLQGFKTFEQRRVNIGTQQVVTIDVLMEVGAVEEELTVIAAVPLVETTTASRGDVLDRTFLDGLPTAGRNPFMVALTIPEVMAAGDRQFNRQQDTTTVANISIGGGPIRGNNYLLDGVPITDMRNRPVVVPSIEAIEEVKIQISTYDAEMTHTGGGVFNTVGKSGANTFAGSGFYQTRPVWGQANNFFLERAGVPKATDQYYRLYGGGIGGRIVRDRTFFWVSTEGYRSMTTRNDQLIFPTDRERRGDFSQTFDRNGNLVVIYDPLTTRPNPDGPGFVRDPFPGNVIPQDRLSTVGQNLASYFPRPQVDISGASGEPNFVATAELVDRADQATVKVNHKFTDNVLLSGMYAWGATDEPQSRFWNVNEFADPAAGLTVKRMHVLAVNTTIVPNATTVISLRPGFTVLDNPTGDNEPFDMSVLGFPGSYIGSIQREKFPRLSLEEYGDAGPQGFISLRHYSWGVSGSVSKYVGRHTLKVGSDFRKKGLDTHALGFSGGHFRFDRQFTQGPDPNVPSLSAGNAFASLLLGVPTGAPASPSQVPLTNPLSVFTNYYAVYAQDDFRIASNVSVNLGIRFEYETGLLEKEDRFAVAFDRDAVSPLAALTGMDLRGGLRYAGQAGFPRHQGDPKLNPAPRVGVAWSVNPRTVLRGGYGIFWAPWTYQTPTTTNYGQIGFTQNTDLPQGQLTPISSLDSPFEDGLVQPFGNTLGLLTGVGGRIEFNSQDRRPQRTQQFSVDVQQELAGNMAITIAYGGSRGDDMHVGGATTAFVNLNQLDPALMALGPALQEQVPNPFFGISEAGPLAGRPTLPRGQLLRPFPQFTDVMAMQVTEARKRYHAVSVKLDRRLTGVWGGRFNYTWSRQDDNVFGESNHFSNRNSGGRPLNSYDLDSEYGRSLLDAPHAVVLAPIVRLPFGEGGRWLNSGLGGALLGGWTFSAIAEFRSGFPLNIVQSSDNTGSFGGTQRPNIVRGVDPGTAGGQIDRLDNYINPGAFQAAAPFTFGDAPRTDPRARTPFRRNVDVVFAKDARVGRSIVGQIRIEMLNLTNTPMLRGPDGVFGRATFGRITQQSGFMRTTQLSFRLSWR